MSSSAESPVLATVPDVGGTDATVEVLFKLLHTASVRRKELTLVQVANGHGGGDPAAGHPATQPDGTVNSYDRLREELDAQEARLAEAYPMEMERVRDIVRQREQANEV